MGPLSGPFNRRKAQSLAYRNYQMRPGFRGWILIARAGAFRDQESNIVVLLVSAEPADVIDNGCYGGLGRVPAIPAQSLNQALLAEFLAGLVP